MVGYFGDEVCEEEWQMSRACKHPSAKCGALLTVAVCAVELVSGRAAMADVTLVREGVARSSIVLADPPSQAAQYAAYELQLHVEKITGATLPMVYGDAPTTGGAIFVGGSPAARQRGVSAEGLQDQEYVIRFLPDAVALIGRDDATTAPDSRPFTEVHGETALQAAKEGEPASYHFERGCVTLTHTGFDDRLGSLEVWVNVPERDGKGSGTILRMDGAHPWTYHIIEHRPKRRIAYFTYAGKDKPKGFTQSPELTPGWHHVLATHDIEGGAIELFVDGKPVGKSNYGLTSCADATLGIGGMVPRGKRIGNAMVGNVAAVRISQSLREPAVPDTPTFELDGPSTCVVLLNASQPAVFHGQQMVTYTNTPPSWYDGQATCYAVFDFLERFCDVRWYAPGELGLVCPTTATLAVKGKDICRQPAFRWRNSRCMSSAYGLTKAIWGDPTSREVQQFARRLRYGGTAYACNHSFYRYYQRFWEEASPHFEGKKAEYFAKGYSGKPPQLCYMDPGLIQQVVSDARATFDGKPPHGALTSGDFFGLVPMDNSQYCKCDACQEAIARSTDTNPYFSTGTHSEYVFEFINRVAREVGKTHPGKTLSALSYAKYAFRPKTLTLEPNVSIQMCVHVRNWWAPGMEKNDMAFYREWVEKEKGRRLLVWLYYCFPELLTRRGFHCFPGFFAHTASRQFKMFHRDGIWGTFLGGGLGELVDTYVTSKLMDDPDLDVDALLDEMFTRFYGPAGDAMNRMYRRIEEIYSKPENYPDDIRTGKKHSHQTEEMAWGYLGTAERMAELGKIMAEANGAATDEVQRKRVQLFDNAIWQYMLAGRRAYEAKSVHRTDVERLKKASPPSATCPRAAVSFGGDTKAADFVGAGELSDWRTTMGYPPDSRISGHIMHDGAWLYLKLVHDIAAGKLVTSADIWSGDDWEIFVARDRSEQCRQIGINPAGRHIALAYAEKAAWEPKVTVSSTRGDETWTTIVAIPLADLLPDGAKPGDTVLLNVIRGVQRGDSPLAWSPIFQSRFRCPARLGTVQLAE